MFRDYLKSVCRCFIILLLITLICTSFMKNQNADKEINEEQLELTNEIKQEAVFTVLIQENKGRFFVTPEESVALMIGAMLSPERIEKILPTDKNERIEFWKMAAVICRTNLTAYWESLERPESFLFPKDVLCMLSREDYLKIYKSSSKYSSYTLVHHQEICEAIESTRGMVLTYWGETIEAPYFYLSNGATRQATINYPYLQSQICLEDLQNDEQVMRKIYDNKYLEDIGIYLTNMEITKDETGYAKTVSFFDINENKIAVEAITIQQKLELTSLAFSFEEYGENHKTAVVTNGVGHGYGASLNYAAFMAQNGNKYDEILKFFYTGVAITKKW